jgi:hypothetical protein
MEACIAQDGEAGVKRVSGMKTGGKGRERLARLLRESGVTGMEACARAFLLARYLKAETGCEVYILNPGKLRMIGQSAKKTGKEDALKLAKFIRRYPQEELSPVSLPAEREEEPRQLISMKQFQGKTRTALVNRLHTLGETGLKKKDPAAAGIREKRRALLQRDTLKTIAESRERELGAAEAERAVYKENYRGDRAGKRTGAVYHADTRSRARLGAGVYRVYRGGGIGSARRGRERTARG